MLTDVPRMVSITEKTYTLTYSKSLTDELFMTFDTGFIDLIKKWKFKEGVVNLSVVKIYIFKTQTGPVAKHGITSPQVGNWTRDLWVQFLCSIPSRRRLDPSLKYVFLHDTRIYYTLLHLSSTDNQCKWQILLLKNGWFNILFICILIRPLVSFLFTFLLLFSIW